MIRILVVEDDDMNRRMLSRRLEIEGYEALVAHDGTEGIETARREKPDLVLMDMSLPGMDGKETTRRLKDDGELAAIPVIGLSAHAMENARPEALEAGCDDYETKPIDFGRLFAKIRSLVHAEDI